MVACATLVTKYLFTCPGVIEQRLLANKDLQHTGPTMLQLALATKVAVKRIRSPPTPPPPLHKAYKDCID
jgi:hypothetical protein